MEARHHRTPRIGDRCRPDLIARLKTKHGPLMFHQSGGCCDGSSPMLYPAGELLVGDGDVRLGDIGGCPFYMSAAQFSTGNIPNLLSMSCLTGRHVFPEGPEGLRF